MKNSDNAKWVYSCYRVTFDSTGSCNFGNYIAKNAVIFGVDNSFNYFFIVLK